MEETLIFRKQLILLNFFGGNIHGIGRGTLWNPWIKKQADKKSVEKKRVPVDCPPA